MGLTKANQPEKRFLPLFFYFLSICKDKGFLMSHLYCVVVFYRPIQDSHIENLLLLGIYDNIFRGANSDFFYMQPIAIWQPIHICPYLLVLLRFNNKNKIMFLGKDFSFPAGVFLFFGFVRALGPTEYLRGTLMIISVSSFQIFFQNRSRSWLTLAITVYVAMVFLR